MNFFQRNKYFFHSITGIVTSVIVGILGLIIFIPSTIKEYNRDNTFYVILDSLYVLLFLFGIGLSVHRYLKLTKNSKKTGVN